MAPSRERRRLSHREATRRAAVGSFGPSTAAPGEAGAGHRLGLKSCQAWACHWRWDGSAPRCQRDDRQHAEDFSRSIVMAGGNREDEWLDVKAAIEASGSPAHGHQQRAFVDALLESGICSHCRVHHRHICFPHHAPRDRDDSTPAPRFRPPDRPGFDSIREGALQAGGVVHQSAGRNARQRDPRNRRRSVRALAPSSIVTRFRVSAPPWKSPTGGDDR